MYCIKVQIFIFQLSSMEERKIQKQCMIFALPTLWMYDGRTTIVFMRAYQHFSCDVFSTLFENFYTNFYLSLMWNYFEIKTLIILYAFHPIFIPIPFEFKKKLHLRQAVWGRKYISIFTWATLKRTFLVQTGQWYGLLYAIFLWVFHSIRMKIRLHMVFRKNERNVFKTLLLIIFYFIKQWFVE